MGRERGVLRLSLSFDLRPRSLLYPVGADETWWRPKEARGDAALRVEALIEARRQAKAARDFVTADAIRAQLSAAGVEVVDKPGGLSEAVITEAFNLDLLG